MICRWVGGGGVVLLGGGVIVVRADELAALALGWGRGSWPEVMPPMTMGNWMSPIIGRGGVKLLPALWGWGRGMLPMKECLGLAGGRPHPRPPL